MNSRRIIILIAALAMGGLAAVGLVSYINGVETAAERENETRTAWVVQEAIPRGTPAAQVIANGLIAETSIPVQFYPATAISSPEAELAGFVAITDLPANTILVQDQFVPPSVVSTGVTDRLEESGLVTVTFTLDQVAGAAYMIEPGDYVNVLARYEGGESGGEGDEGTSRDNSTSYSTDARYLYQRAEVLAVDRNLTPDLGESTASEEEGGAAAAPSNGGLITLAVPPEAVQRIIGVGLESIYLSLIPPNYEPRPLPPLELRESVLPGEDPARLTPYEGLDIVAPANEAPEPATESDDSAPGLPSDEDAASDQ